MCEENNIDRRRMVKMLAAVGLGSITGVAAAASQVGVMIPGKGWVKSSGAQCEGDGTPLQFIPKTAPESNPLDNELANHPKCPYCGMDRTKWHHSRHLVQYDDGLVDGTCSIHCLAISLSLNIDRGPKAIYAADFGSDAKIKPLVNVDEAHYLIGSGLRGTMTKKSKMAFSSQDAAKSEQKKSGGELGGFDNALEAAYLSMASDTMMTRKRRLERRMRMQKKMQHMEHKG